MGGGRDMRGADRKLSSRSWGGMEMEMEMEMAMGMGMP